MVSTVVDFDEQSKTAATVSTCLSRRIFISQLFAYSTNPVFACYSSIKGFLIKNESDRLIEGASIISMARITQLQITESEDCCSSSKIIHYYYWIIIIINNNIVLLS